MTRYNQEFFDKAMQILSEKEKLLNDYLEITKSITHENLSEELENILAQRKEIIDQISEIDRFLLVHAKKLFGNEANAFLAITEFKTPKDANLPPILIPIDNKCKIIYNILCEIKAADEELNNKVQFVRENLVSQIEQVKNNKRIFGYNQVKAPPSLGHVLDKKQ